MTPRGHRVPELHDHAVLLVVNVFKDKLTLAAPWSLEDLTRIVRRRDLDPEVLVRRLREAKVAALAWFVADWFARERQDEVWAALRDRLAQTAPRPRYQRALTRAVAANPEGPWARVLARLASDSPAERVRALATAVREELGARLARAWTRA